MRSMAAGPANSPRPHRTVLALALGCLLMAVLMATMIRSADAGHYAAGAHIVAASERPGDMR